MKPEIPGNNNIIINLISFHFTNIQKLSKNPEENKKDIIENRSKIIELLKRIKINYNELYDDIEEWFEEEFGKELDKTKIENLKKELDNVRKNENVLYNFFKGIIESYDPRLENYEKTKEVMLRIINGFKDFLKLESEFEDQIELTIHNIMATLWFKEIIELILYLFMDAECKALWDYFSCRLYPRKLNYYKRFYVNLEDSKKKLDIALQLFDELFNIEGIEYMIPTTDLMDVLNEFLRIIKVYLDYLVNREDKNIKELEKLKQTLETKFFVVLEPSKVPIKN